MGTRGLTIVVKDKQFKVAQYGQWDHYPSGQGDTVVNFLTSKEFGYKKFCAQVDKVKHLTDAEVHAKWKAEGADESGWVGMDVADKFKEKNFHLSRDCGAEILRYVANAKTPEVYLSTEFAADGLSCEYAYVLDLDKKVLEVYKGFGQNPLPKNARFKFLEGSVTGRETEYYPVKLWKKFPLTGLKKAWAEFMKNKRD